ncbi:hypothetical protein EDS67_28420 [candidate division KSB1 bacterium]|nr:MAG: hypothetical protein EDS67_28420 [candidate division KSB1 bacterium]MBC6948762.1 hypothetical protein [candidate division KSB1 bacterium]MCE7945529.1 hypothetical protein [Chlorobi bacterium CHB1]MDL1878552.1 hypothetical protein [Cytophagia bacterium CHB2]
MLTQKMKYVLKAEAPIAILQSRATSQFVKTLDYLPGSAVRGAFAEIFINKIGTEHDLFQRIFVSEEIRFSDFLPGDRTNAPLLLPATAAACKRHGLAHETSLHDRLFERLLAREQSNMESRKCSCGERLDRLAGVYMQSLEARVKANPRRQLRMHVGISRPRGTATHGQLFSYDMLTAKPQLEKEKRHLYFIGTLASDSPNADRLFAEVEKIVHNREHLSIGKARTRGLGELSIDSRNMLDAESDFETRWQEFTGKFSDQEKRFCHFSITLNSHLILKDALGRPLLSAAAPGDFGLGDEVQMVAKFLSKAIVAGWNAAQGLPKPDTAVLARGSVFGFRAPRENSEEIKTKLRALEMSGVGERRAEGFGQITVCHPFHVKYA